MSEGIVNQHPKKELLYTLGGIALFLAVVLLIGISAFLRPAGEHITPEASDVVEETEGVATSEAAMTTEEAVVTDTDTGTEEMNIGAGEPAGESPATATATPNPSTGDSIVATQAGEATADGVVDQEAVQDSTQGIELHAEQADADLEGEVVSD